jgi:hypothetical protein
MKKTRGKKSRDTVPLNGLWQMLGCLKLFVVPVPPSPPDFKSAISWKKFRPVLFPNHLLSDH